LHADSTGANIPQLPTLVFLWSCYDFLHCLVHDYCCTRPWPDPECGTQCPNCKSAILYRSHQYSLHIWRSCCHCVCLLSLSLSLSLFRLLICLLVCLSPHSLNLILAALNVEMGVSFLSFLIYLWELLLEFQCVR
jgi:hypothetical protein